MVPGNVHHSHEIIVIDDCFSMGLTQINNIFNDLHKLLDLIFINSIVHSNVTLAEFTISNCVVHHKPLCLNIEFYSFLPFNDSKPRYIFDPSSLSSLRDCMLSLKWGALLSNPCIETNYKTFLSTIRNTLDSTGFLQSSLEY